MHAYNVGMSAKTVFNVTVCFLGVVSLIVLIISLCLKKSKRSDEKALLLFFVFTMVHFAIYFTFALIKESYTSNAYIIAFYTLFYIMNNIEMLLFYNYFVKYNKIEEKTKKILNLVNLVLFSLFVFSDLINIFTHIYFTSVNGVYSREPFMILSQGYQFIILAACFVLTLISKNLNKLEKTVFLIYCFLPFMAIIVQNALPGYAIAYAAILVSVEILFSFVNIEKNIKIKEDENKLQEAHMKIMVSQIQPHFIFNTLSSISTLIPIHPDQAQKALDDFSNYLRVNFSTLTESKLVPFEDELKHVQTYVSIEKLRFSKRLDVVFDINTTNFLVPPLSIEPLVENAIKHGLMKKINGGKVYIKTYETEKYYVVEVIDNGIGFDVNEINFSSNQHIGLNNVKQRIWSMCQGTLSFESEIGKGTKVVVTFPKQ